MYGHIVVPLDGSALAETVLPYVEAVASRFGSRVTLVQATMPRLGGAPEVALTVSGEAPTTAEARIQMQRRKALFYLGSVADELAKRKIKADIVHDEGPAEDVIVKVGQRLNADLIAMTTHGAGGLRRFVLGSVADVVRRTVTCPLLLVPVERDEEHDGAPVEMGGDPVMPRS